MKIKESWKKKLRVWRKLIFNWRFLVCFGLAWLITNGWSYLLFGLGILLNNTWMTGIGGAYMTFLWLPISPEKLVTLALCLFLVRVLFPKHNRQIRAEVEQASSYREPPSDAE